MDPSVVALRVLREVAQAGSFTAAAGALGYSQSAISRQVAGLEQVCGARLFDRTASGVSLTAAGRTLLRHAAVVLDALDVAERELAGGVRRPGPVRLGMFISAGAVVVPRALTALRRRRPDLEVTSREGTTPALVRGLRAGTLDLAVLVSRPPHGPPDGESPALDVEPVAEGGLLVAVATAHPLAGGPSIPFEELAGQRWIASPNSGSDPLLGVWPGLAGRPRIAHTARDWLTKLELVAAGFGITTVSPILAPVVPVGVRLLAVGGGPPQIRRLSLTRVPGAGREGVEEVAAAVRRELAVLAP